MKLKYMLAAGAILFSCTASAQTTAGIKAYNSNPPMSNTGTHAILVPNAEVVKSERRAAEQGDAAANLASTCQVNRIIQKADSIQVILRECSNVKCRGAPSNENADFFMKTSDRSTARFLNLIQNAILFNKKITITANQATTTPLQCRFSKIESVAIH